MKNFTLYIKKNIITLRFLKLAPWPMDWEAEGLGGLQRPRAEGGCDTPSG